MAGELERSWRGHAELERTCIAAGEDKLERTKLERTCIADIAEDGSGRPLGLS